MTKINLQSAINSATEMLRSLGIDLEDENYKDTPKRMVEVLQDFTSSLRREESGGGARSF